MDLRGKRVLLTGGARRLGAAIARRLAAAGCRIALHCRHSEREAAELLAALPGSGHTLHVLDLTPPDAPKQLAAAAGDCEFLVNNAAVFHRPGSPEDLAAAAEYRRINFAVPAELLELFCSRKSAVAAVNLTDCAALNPGAGAYYESKRALNRLTERLALQWGPRGVRVNAIAPGAVLPPAWAPDSRMTRILAATPLRRAVTPEEIAALTEFLLACDGMTGAVIPLDGGLRLAR